MIMPANHSSPRIHYWAGRYPGKIGWLIGPSAIRKTKLREWMPFALDNDAFSAWSQKRDWDEQAWINMLNTVYTSGLSPRWILVPDVVADKAGTLRKWEQHLPLAKEYGWPLAFAVQDGMTPSDVPSGADIVFVGGTTKWKWSTVEKWATSFPRVHVGRVNTLSRIEYCNRLGVESVDGTGFFKGSERDRKAVDLARFIEELPNPQLSLFMEEV